MCRGVNEFNNGYQIRSNLEKDENGGRLADFYSILNGCKIHLSQFLNLRVADDFRQVVGYTTKLLVPELSALNLVVTGNVKKYKESVIDVILVEMIEAESSAVCSEIHKLFITF
jgi:hypothetical protein